MAAGRPARLIESSRRQYAVPVGRMFALIAQGHFGHAGAVDNRPTHGPLDSRENPSLVNETHLRLARMHIYIHLRRVQVDEKDGQGITPDRQESVIGLDDCVGQAAILHIAPVDEQDDLGAVGAGERRQADVAPNV